MKKASPESKSSLSVEREFGLVFCAVFFLIAFVPLFKGHPIRVWAVALSGGFLTFALIFPARLKCLSAAWMKLGLLMHQIANPIILGIVYFGVVWPIGAMMKRFKGGSMRVDFDPSATTYWIQRNPAGPDPKTMKQQF